MDDPSNESKESPAARFFEAVKDFLTAREPGCGYFQGAEGALRFVAFAFFTAVAIAVALVVW